MRVYLEPSNAGELEQSPEELLDKLTDAFIELGMQLMAEPLEKAHSMRHHGEVDALEVLYTKLSKSYEQRLKELRDAILAEADA